MLGAVRRNVGRLWAFGRPHTLIATSASVVALWAVAADVVPGVSPYTFAVHGSLTLIAALAANVFIVGLNQITDVAIDRINKPFLPIPAGKLSTSEARGWVAIAGVIALLASAIEGYFLFGTVVISMIIGTAYSVPPLRLKRNPVLAAISIALVRGVVVNAGTYLHAVDVLGAPAELPPRIQLLIAFVVTFSLAIAIAKDLPDTEGDRRHSIPTFAVLFGRKTAFWLASTLLAGALLLMVAAGVVGVPGVDGVVLSMAHVPLAFGLVMQARSVELADKSSIQRFYRVVWFVFSVEYAIFPIACFLG